MLEVRPFFKGSGFWDQEAAGRALGDCMSCSSWPFHVEKIIGAGKGKTSSLVSDLVKRANGFTGNPASVADARRLESSDMFVIPPS